MSSARISSAKVAALLTRIQLNPEILTEHSSFISDLIDRAAEMIVSYCNMPRYPALSVGESISRIGVSENIASIGSNELKVSINGGVWGTLTLVLTSLTSGTAIATELQTKIQAEATEGWDETTVAFAGSGDTAQYTFSSGRYGESSSINLSWNETNKHVAQNLGLGIHYGGIEYSGMAAMEDVDDLLVSLVEKLYRKVGIEGAAMVTIPGSVQAVFAEDPLFRQALQNRRRYF